MHLDSHQLGMGWAAGSESAPDQGSQATRARSVNPYWSFSRATTSGSAFTMSSARMQSSGVSSGSLSWICEHTALPPSHPYIILHLGGIHISLQFCVCSLARLKQACRVLTETIYSACILEAEWLVWRCGVQRLHGFRAGSSGALYLITKYHKVLSPAPRRRIVKFQVIWRVWCWCSAAHLCPGGDGWLGAGEQDGGLNEGRLGVGLQDDICCASRYIVRVRLIRNKLRLCGLLQQCPSNCSVPQQYPNHSAKTSSLMVLFRVL